MRIQKILFLILVASVFSGCQYWWNPSCTGHAPAAPGCYWEPTCLPDRSCVDPCISVFPESGDLLDIGGLIDIALQNNPDTYASWTAARSAAFEWAASRSTCYPQVDYAASYNVVEQDFHYSEDSIVDQMIEIDLTASYLLYDFGGRSAHIEAARQALHAANWTHNHAIQEVILNVQRTYYALIDAQASLEARKDDFEDAQKSVQVADALHEMGLQMRLDVLQAQSNLVKIQLELEELNGEVKVRMGRLANALGLPADTQLNVQDLPETISIEEISGGVERLVETAKKSRPDLAAAHARYLAKKAQADVAGAAGKPRFVLGGEIHTNDYFRHNRPDKKIYRASIGFQMPIFRGFFFYNQERRACEDARTAYADWKSQESNATLDVVISYTAYKTAEASLKYSDEFLKYTQEAYDAALSGYQGGITPILDLLAAQSSLAAARAEHIRARTEWLIALASLAYATGTL